MLISRGFLTFGVFSLFSQIALKPSPALKKKLFAGFEKSREKVRVITRPKSSEKGLPVLGSERV